MWRPASPNPLLSFFVLAFALTWAYWIPSAMASRGLTSEKPSDLRGIVAGYGPAIAAIVVTYASQGTFGLKDLGRRLLLWRVRPLWYVVALCLPAAQALAAWGLQRWFGGPSHAPAVSDSLGIVPAGTPFILEVLLLFAMFTLGFDGLGEELGWRGFALPRLLDRCSALTASMALGGLWATWHVPMALVRAGPMSGAAVGQQLSHMLAVSVVFTWLFANTRGSILLAILFHAANNVTYNALPLLLPHAYETGVWGELLRWSVVAAIVATAGPVRLSRKLDYRASEA